MLLSAVNTFIKYVLHTIDLQSEDPWDNKAIYLRYVDIVLGASRKNIKIPVFCNPFNFVRYVQSVYLETPHLCLLQGLSDCVCM